MDDRHFLLITYFINRSSNMLQNNIRAKPVHLKLFGNMILSITQTADLKCMFYYASVIVLLLGFSNHLRMFSGEVITVNSRLCRSSTYSGILEFEVTAREC